MTTAPAFDAKADHRRRKAARRAALAASATYALLLSVQGVYLPFFPAWLADRGFDAGDIGLLLAIPMLMRALASAPLSRIGDTRLGPRRTFLIMSCGAAIGYASLSLTHGFWTLAAAMLAMSALLAPTVPLLDLIVLNGVAIHGHDYGRIRQWGSLCWLLTTLAAGKALAMIPLAAVPPLLAALSALTVLCALSLPNDRRAVAAPVRRAAHGEAPALALFLVFALAVACLQGAHSLLYSFGTLIWKGDGFTSTQIGVLWAVGASTEAAFFLTAGAMAVRFEPYHLILAGGTIGLLRWVCMGLAPTSGWVVAGLQASHALTFACVHLGTMAWVSRFSRGRAARQGAIASAVGAGLAAGSILAGELYSRMGTHGFFVMAGVSACGIGLTLLARGIEARGGQPQSEGSGGNTMLPS